jgi:plastocyanin
MGTALRSGLTVAVVCVASYSAGRWSVQSCCHRSVRILLPGVGAILLSLVGAACGGGREEVPPTSAVVSNPVDPATAGSVRGAIRFEGTPPAPEEIRMDSDPNCEKFGTATTETVTVGPDGALQNVFVYVKDGLGNRTFPVPTTPVVIDQKGCRYVPHVLGVQVGQTFEITSSDNTLHNVHAIPANNREFNKSHPLAGISHTHTFSTAEVMVPFKCDVHRWMNAYVGVLDHPFFAVTGSDGAFELNGLPPGTYTIEAWHEKLGTQTQSVTIGDRQTSDVAFTFKI